MDFFGHQDRARRKTVRLIVGFLIGLVLLVLAIDVAAWGLTALANQGETPPVEDIVPILVGVSILTVAIVGLGSLYKSKSLARGGGAAVARSLGARPVLDTSTSAEDRRLRNVVEEMAIASGLPVPQIFVMEGERGINAFAAGVEPGDAVVAVTRGTLDTLDRDELQGVIAHEFSHILNGDMRLNVRLIGLLFGILLMATTGRILIYSLRHVRVRGKAGAVIGILFLAGLALLVLGSVGYLVGRILKASVSRQREYLADASAVQFTRNPGGLSGAFQRMLGRGSRVKHVRASEVSHLFFGNALKSSWLGLFSTHPPLEDRLDRIDPGWQSAPAREKRAPRSEQARPRPSRPAGFQFPAGEVAGLVGRLDVAQPETGEEALSAVPEELRVAASEPFSARALALAAIVDPRPEIAAPAYAVLEAQGERRLARETARLFPHVKRLGKDETLTVVLLAIPALREMSDRQRGAFVTTLRDVVASDGVVTLEEHALAELVALHLGFLPPPRRRPRPERVRDATSALLGVLARSAADDEAAAASAYALGAEQVGLDRAPPPEPPDPRETFHLALAICRTARPDDKRKIVTAASYAVSADGMLVPTEVAMLRLVVDALGCPLPRIARTAAD